MCNGKGGARSQIPGQCISRFTITDYSTNLWIRRLSNERLADHKDALKTLKKS